MQGAGPSYNYLGPEPILPANNVGPSTPPPSPPENDCYKIVLRMHGYVLLGIHNSVHYIPKHSKHSIYYSVTITLLCQMANFLNTTVFFHP
jgi:hypothetical protein